MNQWKTTFPEAADKQFASTVAQGIDVLAAFRPGDNSLRNRDISERTGIPRPTVTRLAATLVQLGYLRRNPSKQAGYLLGFGLLTLGYPLLASMQLRQMARPLMTQLASEINGAVSLVIRDGLDMLYVETARANEGLLTHPDIGSTLPMLTTAAGRAWLCSAPANERQDVMNSLRVKLPRQYEQGVQGVERAMKDFSRLGYCYNNTEWRADSYGFAIPLRRALHSRLFVFNCGVPLEAGSFEELNSIVPPKLASLVRGVEAMLGLDYGTHPGAAHP
ncbi:helix-turn-helix domain-containing protein [Pusillimonas sp. SM2304]|uniref:IclR family transcriptional regulator n=1 Tax=Pusillimonas sp. SM2304 TaxID=3073241 RepID=UPI002875F1DD|nr:helix-turn-helix domain-containing protein [Pusillimonas sp. SM2304]MDS1139483.1 helix-turn-helix domain-containing protein [Pusillimonas sp. SM2304]